MKTLTQEEFKNLARERGLMNDTDTWRACKLVMCDGYTATAAAKETGLKAISSVTRALKKLKSEKKHCDSCGKRLPWGVA